MSNHNGILLILCGLPCSGKSMFAVSLKDYLSRELPIINSQIIDIDQIRLQFFDDIFLPENEVKVRGIAHNRTRQLLNTDSVVIIDDVNYYNSMRHDFRQIAVDLNKPYLIIFISTPLEICLQWNAHRINPLNEEIITKIADNFDVPGQKYAWDIPFDAVDISKDDITKKISHIGQHILRLIHKFPDILDPTEKNTPNRDILLKTDLDQLTRLFIHLYALQKHPPEKMSLKTDIFSWNGIDLTEVFNTIAKSSLFHQIQKKYHSNLESLNNVRKIFLETRNYTEIPHFTPDNFRDKDNLKELLRDFMVFLLNFQNLP